ncbi:hypothetical protein HNP52_003938 [Sphingomonas kyeonggiensis]|uniref:Uncharacterized protein n=1 Tax=Sphingomonas kyeonggiensis TaxID=1268553 RepID=A0A7W7NUC0_9SPHN|nr:hypothetical protein [Sphingomonas kyeonggiensis]MBB4840841.1 hypothetical protein [Sphingomonas kyeonggiensis]
MTWWFGNHRDREASRRAITQKYYEEFAQACFTNLGMAASYEDRRRWAIACNTLYLMGSATVFEHVERLRAFAEKADIQGYERELAATIWAMRSELGIRSPTEEPPHRLALWAAPVPES